MNNFTSHLLTVPHQIHLGDEKNALRVLLKGTEHLDDDMRVVSKQDIHNFDFIYRVVGKSVIEDESRLVQNFEGYTIRTLGEIRKAQEEE